LAFAFNAETPNIALAINDPANTLLFLFSMISKG
jgi:hypothetical protein